MQLPKSLSEFFTQSHTRYRVFDLGRGLRKLDSETFRQFEDSELPYPYPLQQQAWLGILGWNSEEKAEQFIWFLKFPLDETGKLVPTARDSFLHGLLETLGSNIQAAREGGEFNDAMRESPFGFKPKESMMAGFHARALKALSQPASRYYDHARDYLDGKPGYDQWAFVGLQGFADVAARLDSDNNETRVLKALPQLPAPALSALCGFLENESLSTALSEAMLTRLQQELSAGEADLNVITALLRAFALSGPGLAAQAVEAALTSPLGTNIHLLAAIAARNWELLKDEAMAARFIEALAGNTLGHDAFAQVMGDLLAIPGMRAVLLAQLRSPDRSEALSAAVGHMFGQNF
ncbi:MAG: DUF3549 family protein [Chromatiales bacterium]|nr:DUF3549 family protein [Chromatiales bacterium]